MEKDAIGQFLADQKGGRKSEMMLAGRAEFTRLKEKQFAPQPRRSANKVAANSSLRGGTVASAVKTPSPRVATRILHAIGNINCMGKRQPSEIVYRSKGLTVHPSGKGWKPTKTLVYTFAFEFEIEQDEEGWLVATVPALPGCNTQARTEEELIERLREAVELAIEESADPLAHGLFATKRS